jgi:ubiquitin carboxyl-terminal hydrolase L5
VDSRKKRAKSSAKQKKKSKRDKSKADKSGGSSAYHFIAFVPVGQQVWQLDGLTSTPVCIGKRHPLFPPKLRAADTAPGEYDENQHWTSVMRPVLEERMMRYETERLSFSLLALCGDNLAHVRQKLAANIRSLADLEADIKHNDNNSPHSKPKAANRDIITNPTDPRLSAYQLDAEDINQAAASEPQEPKKASDWETFAAEQRRILAEYDNESQMGVGGQEPAAILGRTRDYTGAVHVWVKKLAERGVLRRLFEEVTEQGAA